LANPTAAKVPPAGISPLDVSLATGMSLATINRPIRDNTLKSVKIAGRRLIAYPELARVRGE
jgi:hypothetical protein